MDPLTVFAKLLGLNVLGLDSDLSLYALLMLCTVSMVAARRLPLSWSWPVYVKSSSLAITAILGLTTGPKWIFATLGWSLFAILYLLPLFLFKKLTKAMAELNGRQAVDIALLLKLFNWGESGHCVYDSAKFFALYLEGDKETANKLLDFWLAKAPKQLHRQLSDARLTNYALSNDWQPIIREYQLNKQQKIGISNRLYLTASRAYAELGNFKEAAECLAEAQSSGSRNDTYTFAMALLQFYCLTGASEKSQALLKLLSYYKYPIQDYTKYYWLGREALIKGEQAEASSLFASSLKSADKLPAWQKRINDQINQLQQGKRLNALDSKSTVSLVTDQQRLLTERLQQNLIIERVQQNLNRSMRVQELMYPKTSSPAVLALIGIILFAFLCTNIYSFFPDKLTELIEISCYNNGVLIPANVISGQYWRLLSFLFLHAHLVHAMLNILALYWFGRVCAKIYGTAPFLLIYFVAGIASGISSTIFSPLTPAIGASGAIMGIFGAVGIGIFRLKNFLPQPLRRRQLTLMISLLAFQLVIDQIIPHIDVSAHIGGLVAGIIVAMLLPIPIFKTGINKLPKNQASSQVGAGLPL